MTAGIDRIDHDGQKALRTLPDDFRKPLAYFWSMNVHLLPSPLPLTVRVQLWMAKDGLTAEDLRTALARLSDPAKSATHRFPGDLLADLAAEVSAVLDARMPERVEFRRAELTDRWFQTNTGPKPSIREMVQYLAKKQPEAMA